VTLMRVSMVADPADAPGCAAAVLEPYTAFAENLELPLATRLETHLVLDEVVSNIVRHAAPAGRPCRVSVSLELAGEYLHVAITDDGDPFDPMAPVVPHRPPGEAPDGGFGLLLTKRFAERLDYVREGHENRVTFRKRVPYVRIRELLRAQRHT
jgi:anti-sigma regulatory factor (Ser/Thr protein kinase)